MKSKSHWQNIFSSKKITEMSWHQTQADKSLLLVDKTQLGTEAHIIDVGGGVSVLVDDLIDRNYQNITVLDISDEALEQTKTRLGKEAKKVKWIEGDIINVELSVSTFDIWQDRAVFHFLISPDDRSRYLGQLRKAQWFRNFLHIQYEWTRKV